MFRRRFGSVLLAAAAGQGSGSSSKFEEHGTDEGDEAPNFGVEPGGYGMQLTTAYRMFGYRMGDKIEKAEVKKRFKTLSKRAHPDLGGKEEDFMRLMEAQKLLLTHAHDPKAASGNYKSTKERKVGIRKQTHADIFNSVTWENAEEHRETIPVDYILGVVMFFGFLYLYRSSLDTGVMRSSDGRSRLREDQMKPQNEETVRPRDTWHPWKASPEMRDQVRELEEDRLERIGLRAPSSGEKRPTGSHSPFATA